LWIWDQLSKVSVPEETLLRESAKGVVELWEGYVWPLQNEKE